MTQELITRHSRTNAACGSLAHRYALAALDVLGQGIGPAFAGETAAGRPFDSWEKCSAALLEAAGRGRRPAADAALAALAPVAPAQPPVALAAAPAPAAGPVKPINITSPSRQMLAALLGGLVSLCEAAAAAGARPTLGEIAAAGKRANHPAAEYLAAFAAASASVGGWLQVDPLQRGLEGAATLLSRVADLAAPAARQAIEAVLPEYIAFLKAVAFRAAALAFDSGRAAGARPWTLNPDKLRGILRSLSTPDTKPAVDDMIRAATAAAAAAAAAARAAKAARAADPAGAAAPLADPLADGNADGDADADADADDADADE